MLDRHRFANVDSPDKVCALLAGVASELPQLRSGLMPTTVALGSGKYRTTVGLESPVDDGAAQATFLRWIWYAVRREELHLDNAGDKFSTTEQVQSALRTVVGPKLRLSLGDQQAVLPYATVVRYGTDEIVQHADVVPKGMGFIVAGRVTLTAMIQNRSVAPLGYQGALLGVTALTRQPNPNGAVALEEVTVLEIDREHLEHVVMNKPMLLQELGRLIDERQSKFELATQSERVG